MGRGQVRLLPGQWELGLGGTQMFADQGGAWRAAGWWAELARKDGLDWVPPLRVSQHPRVPPRVTYGLGSSQTDCSGATAAGAHRKVAFLISTQLDLMIFS